MILQVIRPYFKGGTLGGVVRWNDFWGFVFHGCFKKILKRWGKKMIQWFRVKNPVKFRGMTAVSCWDSFENQDDKNASHPWVLGCKTTQEMKEICRKRADADSPDSGDGRISRSIRNAMLFSYKTLSCCFYICIFLNWMLSLYTKEHQQ